MQIKLSSLLYVGIVTYLVIMTAATGYSQTVPDTITTVNVDRAAELANGSMTGGGSVLDATTQVTHSFVLSCDVNLTPNNLQVNWKNNDSKKSNRFHLENLTSVFCIDNPAIEPGQSDADFDTYEGRGIGRYNNIPNASAHWIFTDAGEPGNNDTAMIQIWDAKGDLVLSVFGNLKKGNHQAHGHATKLVSIDVTPVNPTVALGQTQQFIANGTFSDGNIKNITDSTSWSSSNTTVAAINASGLATAASPGVTKINATIGGISSADQTMTVTDVSLVSIDVTPVNPTIALGQTQQFTANGTYSDGSIKDITSAVTWLSSNTSVADVNISGLATPASIGTTLINATIDGISSPDQTLTVTDAKLVSIEVTPVNPTVALGQTQQFIANGTYSDASVKNITTEVTWSSSNTTVADIDTSGLATPISLGTTLINAAIDGISSTNQTLTVTDAKLISIEVTPVNPAIALGQTQQFTANGTYSDGSIQNITDSVVWSSSNISVADIDISGLATSISPGTTLINATIDGISSTNQTLTVTDAKILSIEVTPVNPTISLGQTQQFTANGTYSDGSIQNITDSVIWSSSDITVASINASGLAASVSRGTTLINAAIGEIISPDQTLTVTDAKLVSIEVTPVNPTVALGQTQQFIANGTYSDASVKNITTEVTWSSSNTTVADIDTSGLVTPASIGATLINATIDGISSPDQTLTVTNAKLLSIEVTPVNPTVALGQTQQFIANGTYSDGSIQNITDSVIWSSSDITVASINASGLATSVSRGTTLINAAIGEIISPDQTLTVTDAKLISIEVTPVNPTTSLGQTQQFTANGTYSDGSIQNITDSVVWSSSNTSVADIDISGLATSISPGTTLINATSDGISSTNQTLTVTDGVSTDYIRPVVEVSILPIIANVNESVIITVKATDNVGVTSKKLTVNGIPIELDSSGNATYSSSVAGVFEAVGTAFDLAGNEGLDKKEFRFLSPGDIITPTVDISSPDDYSNLNVPTNIIGTASDTNLTKYKLEYSVKDKNEFITFAEGSSSVNEAVLGTLDTTMLRNGLYDIRLTAEDASGNTASITKIYQLDGEMKVGSFSISFSDLIIPVEGMPITITRTYDSRLKSKGDFGTGWTLNIKDIELQESGVMGKDWEQVKSGGYFPTYSLLETKPHYVTLTYPDGEIDEFSMKVDPSNQQLMPIEYTTASFTAKPGTSSSLVSLDNNVDLMVIKGVGSVELYDLNLELYDPNHYQLITKDGKVYTINQQTGLENIRDTNGNTITFGADGIIHSSGKSVTFTRDSQGRITTITDPMGGTIKYEYDNYGDLVSMTDQEERTTKYKYNSDHGLVDIVDPRGITPARIEYDDEGRVIAYTDAEGNKIEYTHNIGAKQEIVKDRLGSITVYNYDDKGNILQKTDPLGGTTQYTYDERGNVLTETDPLGKTATKTYDSTDNLLSQTDPLGNTVTYTYNSRGQVLTITDAKGSVTTNTYDANGNLISITDELGQVTTYQYDSAGSLIKITEPNGKMTSYTYDGVGNMVSQTDALGNVRTYTYDANGNMLSESEPSDITTTYVYDKTNQLVKTIDTYGNADITEYNAIGKKAAVVDRLGHRTQKEYDARGNLISVIYPDGTYERFTYDAENRKLTSTDREGRTTSYTYDKLGKVIKTTYPDGTFAQSEYDAAGRITKLIDERGNPTLYTYDSAGRQTSVIDALGGTTTYAYDANSNIVQMTDARGNVFQYKYDVSNRKIKTIFPDSTSASTAYDALGRKVSETDQAGNTQHFEYDSLGRFVKITDALGQATNYAYDANGNIISQTDANGHTTSFEYDKLGRLTKRILPLGMSEITAYDAAGNVLSQTDFNGNTITFTYDVNNRLTKKSYPDGTSDSFTYKASGKRKTVTDSQGVTSYEYDARDRLVKQTNPDGRSLTYAYDAAGNRISLIVPSGTTSYTFDALNRLSTVTDPEGGVTSYSYDAVGNRASVTYPNGAVAEYTYDSLNRLTNLLNRKSGGEVISSYAYTLAPVGNRIRVVEDTGRTVDYTYDQTYKLTNESINDPVSSRMINYTYDAVGNRLIKADGDVITTYTYDANDRLLSEGDNTYTYDKNGNTLTRIGSSSEKILYSYDFQNRLIQADTTDSSGSSVVKYAYNADGIRILKNLDGIDVTNYLVDKNQPYAQVLLETDGTGSTVVSYVYGDDLISQNRNGLQSYYHSDGQMSTRKLTNATGDVTDSYEYDAFGILLNQTGTTINNYLYTGEQFDPNIGFYYLRARYYNSDIGRFLTADMWPGSIYDPQTLHKYVYTHNDPINFIDPSGKFFFSFSSLAVSMSASSILCTVLQPVIVVYIPAIVYTSIISEQILHPAYELRNEAILGLNGGENDDELLQIISNSQKVISFGYLLLGHSIQAHVDANDIITIGLSIGNARASIDVAEQVHYTIAAVTAVVQVLSKIYG